jgi:hypothetical protein
MPSSSVWAYGFVQPEKPLATVFGSTGEVLPREFENATDDGAEQ